MVVYAMLTPIFASIEFGLLEGSVRLSLESAVWGLAFFNNLIPPIWIYVGSGFLFAIVRLIFVWSIYKYYQGSSSQRMNLVLGIITDFYLFFFTILFFLQMPVYSAFIIVILPIPLMLPARYLVLRMIPPPKQDLDWDKK
jgi:hypothetical protein